MIAFKAVFIISTVKSDWNIMNVKVKYMKAINIDMKRAQESCVSQVDLGADLLWWWLLPAHCMATVGGWCLQSWEPDRRFCAVVELNTCNRRDTLWARTSLSTHQLKITGGKVKAILCFAIFVFTWMRALTSSVWTTWTHQSLRACRSGSCHHVVHYQGPDLWPKHRQVTYPSASRRFYSTSAVRKACSCSPSLFQSRQRQLLNPAVFNSGWFGFVFLFFDFYISLAVNETSSSQFKASSSQKAYLVDLWTVDDADESGKWRLAFSIA